MGTHGPCYLTKCITISEYVLLAHPCHTVRIQQNLPVLFDIFGELGIVYQ